MNSKNLKSILRWLEKNASCENIINGEPHYQIVTDIETAKDVIALGKGMRLFRIYVGRDLL